MFGTRSLSRVICILLIAQMAVMQVTGQTFLYGKPSCEDLIPRHPDAIAHANKMNEMTNHVQQPTEATETTATGNTDETGSTTTATTTTTTSTTTMAPTVPPPKVGRYRGSLDVRVLTSEDAYRRLKTLIVTLESPEYINGFMLQARKATGNRAVVGRFLKLHHRAEFLTCPNGSEDENSAINDAKPLRLANITFTWMAPEKDLGPIEFVASVLLSEGTEYKIYRSARLTLSMYPVSTKDCAVAKSCFRYCMDYGGRECLAHKSRYMATMEYMAKKTRAKITMGGQLPDSSGYLAVGFSKDGNRLSNADIAVCYRNDDDVVGVEHYLLENIDYPPDLHLGILNLDSSDVDQDYVWCSFTRPLTGKGPTVLDLSDPSYYFYFWGMRNGTTIYLPEAQSLKRSDNMIDLKDEPFNEILYNSAPRRQAPYSVVAALIIFIVAHFLW